MYQILKFFLFAIPPERAHHLTVTILDMVTRWSWTRRVVESRYTAPPLPVKTSMGLTFPNPVGLAAGFDKDGKHIASMASIGFGFVEVGTVTPVPQDGNPKPRLFRLPADHALINRMGFNNEGLAALATRLQAMRQSTPTRSILIGGNIGKNKNTPNESAHEDYLACFNALHQWVDYFVVNVSSPNTPNLRDLQEKEPLTRLLTLLQERNQQVPVQRPILLKIAPDLTDEQLIDIADIVQATRLAGVIATNTTISRYGLHTPDTLIEAIGMGGLSGKPVRARSTHVIATLRRLLGPEPVIIGVGGIDSVATAQEKLDAGANLIQVYTGLIYQGPGLIKSIVKGLAAQGGI
jgi:dihydroorotate dehydrogenase